MSQKLERPDYLSGYDEDHAPYITGWLLSGAAVIATILLVWQLGF